MWKKMGCNNYEDLLRHKGHKIVCVSYGDDNNVAIECESCNEVLMDFDKEKDTCQYGNITISRESIEKLCRELESKIYNSGMYRKLSGNWDILVLLDDEYTEEAFEEMEEGEDWRLIFQVTATNNEEEHQTKNSWRINVDVDKDLNIKKIEEY